MSSSASPQHETNEVTRSCYIKAICIAYAPKVIGNILLLLFADKKSHLNEFPSNKGKKNGDLRKQGDVNKGGNAKNKLVFNE